MKVLKFILAAIFCLGLTIAFPFTSANGLDWVKVHGKLLLFVIAIVNTIIGGAISGSFFTAGFKDGFIYWLKPFKVNGAINPTHGFGAITLLWNIFVVIEFVKP